MDSITHGLLGAVVAQTGLRQRIGRDATWVAAVAGYSPDLDMFVPWVMSLGGGHVDGFARMTIHRGLSHSLLMVPLIAALFAVPWWVIRRRLARRSKQRQTRPVEIPDGPAPRRPGGPSFGLLYACCFASVLAHPLLDWCTSYGTQLFAPISNTRFALHSMPIVDIIYTPTLILTLLVCYAARKVLRGRSGKWTLIVGWVGLLLSTGYLATGLLLHDAAVAKALRGVQREKVIRADAYPTVGTIFLWRAVIRTEDRWIVKRIHHFADEKNPPRTKTVAATQTTPWIERAKRTPQYERYNWFALGQIRSEQTDYGDRHVIRFHDMRYSWSSDGTESLWPLEVTFSKDGALRSAQRKGHGPPRKEFWRRLGPLGAAAWRDIWNP